MYKNPLTAGRPKKAMAKTEKNEATSLPIQALGTVSPYPIVVTVFYKMIHWTFLMKDELVLILEL